MNGILSIDEAAQACSVSRDTIKRRLRAGQFPGAARGAPVGHRQAPWLIPAEDLAAAGLRPVVLSGPTGEGIDVDDPVALRVALAHHEAVAAAREAHLADLRGELRRLHACVETLTRLFDLRGQQRPGPGAHQDRECAAPNPRDCPGSHHRKGVSDDHQEEGHEEAGD